MLSNKELGLYLKKIREERELSLRQVDCQSSISYSHLSMIENGTRKPTALTLKELARVYNLDYIDLYEKAGYIDLAESEKLSFSNNDDFRYAEYNGINTDGLDETDIEEIKQYVEFVRSKKNKENNNK